MSIFNHIVIVLAVSMNIIKIVHPFPNTLLQPLLGNNSLQADSADNEDHTSESVCLLLKKRCSTDTCLTLRAMADGSGVNMRNNIEMRDTEFFVMISPKTVGNYLKCILACFRTEHWARPCNMFIQYTSPVFFTRFIVKTWIWHLLWWFSDFW